MTIRDSIADVLTRLAEEGDSVLPVDVLARTGIRVDHIVPQVTSTPFGPARLGRKVANVDVGVVTDRVLTVTEPDGASVDPDSSRGAESLLVAHTPVLAERYAISTKLGEGGMGEVHLASDRNLGREVALKTIPPHRMNSRRLARFVAEARITAQLEHPGIIPIHDLFISEGGDVYYTMKRVQGQTLSEVLEELRSHEPAAVERYTLNYLLTVFRSACQAVAYAHTRRVVHRDLKPGNIMLGDFGEVLVLDWGVARMLDDAPEELLEVLRDGASLLSTADGAMVGSPAYMAPEGLRGAGSTIGTQADVYSLGVLLYEILALQRPFRAENLPRLLYLVAQGELMRPSERAPHRDIPSELENICMRALSRDPRLRYADAGELTRELEGYLDGVRPRQEANRLVAEGKELMLLYARKASDAEEADVRARSLAAELQTWDPIELKRLAWQAEQDCADAQAEADHVFGDCEAAFESALSHLRGYRPARIGLADLYWIRFLQAEEARDVRWTRRWGELIRRYAPTRYEKRLQGHGTLTLKTEPPGARATLYELELEDGRQEPGESRELGETDLDRVAVPMGSYLLRLQLEGYATITMPVVLARLQNLRLSVTFVPEAGLRPGFVHVPAGPAMVGGDPASLSGIPEAFIDLEDFAMARYPVTVSEYLEFLSDLRQTDAHMAAQRSPRARGSRGARQVPLFQLPADGSYGLPFADRDGTEWHAEQPIVSIDLDDAAHYAEWLSERDGVRYRLPTEDEWEKAARGADRRIFPWGDQFDASFCVMSESSPDAPDLPAIGAVPHDRSPYGVRDLAGGVRDWCAPGSMDDNKGNRRLPIRGGSYGTVEIYCRCASRSLVEPGYVGSHVGFRLVHELPAVAR